MPMQLGTLLDGAKNKPPVTRPVTFRLGAENAGAQKTSIEAQAVLVYISDEQIEDIYAAADSAIAARFKGKPSPPPEVFEFERRVQFIARALRAKDDCAQPFCNEGADQLRPLLTRAVGARLMNEYDTFIDEQYNPSPPASSTDKMKDEARGK